MQNTKMQLFEKYFFTKCYSGFFCIEAQRKTLMRKTLEIQIMNLDRKIIRLYGHCQKRELQCFFRPIRIKEQTKLT